MRDWSAEASEEGGAGEGLVSGTGADGTLSDGTYEVGALPDGALPSGGCEDGAPPADDVGTCESGDGERVASRSRCPGEFYRTDWHSGERYGRATG